MRDEPQDNQPRQPDMPFISTPTETVYNHKASSGSQPSITSADAPATTDFVLGIDTCGFTTASTITCEYGYECTNIENYRGCCMPGGDDCASTIHTDCVDYMNAPNPAYCGPHTLCCPSTVPFCFTYGFSTSEKLGATFTHVQCQETPGYGEMYPLPPELITTTSAEGETSPSSSSSSLMAQPTDESSSHETPVGAIVGAVIGAVVLIVLAIVAAVLLIRRRHHRAAIISRRNERARDIDDKLSSDATAKEAGRLRPLSTIHEQASPIASPVREKRKSGRHSIGPQYLNPLRAHPVGLEGGLSRSATVNLGSSTSSKKSVGTNTMARINEKNSSDSKGVDKNSDPRVPMLQIPIPRHQGSRLAPPPPPKSKPKSSSGSPQTPTGASALQSPRTSSVPLSPIEVAFGSEGDKRASRLSLNPFASNTSSSDLIPGVDRAGDSASSVSSAATTSPAVAAAASRSVGVGADAMARTDGSTSPKSAEPVSPIEPIDDEDSQRLSFISIPSTHGEEDHERSELVSPISPESPAPVSPLESRRGSLEP
ncbi:hypothetical protein F5B20DRAFT_444712 [Whalleya microplaca]|nr:hypothetical protein F5B20DRAFT_444712 [Whalleya microplaca]